NPTITRSSETVFNFQTAFPSFETGYWELSFSKILHLLLPRQHLGQNGRRLQSQWTCNRK
ncbi:hypothetical protein, partial [Neisseria gonorrhoeae]|uniref:hypothetical protein n=1 Tax=Neisseria gonorrhoeae TaxID=485 RepID=UPI004058012B